MAERDYVLGTHDDEIYRLGYQHRVWRPRALDAWQRARIGDGCKVIDFGAGPGFATMDLAEIVGPTGEVHALERSRRFLDTLEAQVSPVEGAPALVRVSIVARRGEDYSSAEETHVVVDPRGARPAVRWAGRGDFRQSDYTVCERLRTTTVRVEGGVLRVRSRVSRAVSPRSGGVSPRLHATLARECRAPAAVTVDFAL